MKRDPSSESITRLHARLRASRGFGDQAEALVEHFEALFGARDVTIGRVGIHLRDQRGYQAVHTGKGEHDQLQAASMWRWVEERAGVVLLDLLLELLTSSIDHRGESTSTRGALDAGEQLELSGSLVNLLDGPTTHVMAAPLWGFGRSIRGMLTIELEAPGCTGLPEPLLELGDQVEIAASLAGAQLLLASGDAPDARVGEDEWLPVVGDAMGRKLVAMARFAASGETLLLAGASGTGKSRLARWCHEHSPREGEPFETLSLLTVPHEMQMAELFGWRKGAFTGAVNDMPGAIERAQGGTLFIDEIDKLSLDAQAGLLQLLEEGMWRKLGDSSGARKADVRFIVGTNQDLLERVRAGAFRQDLYFRINVLPMHMPTLDERRDEIADWSRFMLARASNGAPAAFEPAAIARLERERWPGNLRQLDNVIRRAMIMARVRDHDVVAREDIEAALAMESPQLGSQQDLPAVKAAMTMAADALVDLAITMDERGESLDLDMADALKGILIARAVARLDGDADHALTILGKRGAVENRNQHRIIKRERERVDALDALLSELELGARFS